MAFTKPSPEQLRAHAPKVKAILDPVKTQGMQCGEGLLLHLQDLYSALENGDFLASRKAFKDVIDCVLGEEPTPQPMMGMADASAVGKIDWSKFGELLKTLLPLLIGLFA